MRRKLKRSEWTAFCSRPSIINKMKNKKDNFTSKEMKFLKNFKNTLKRYELFTIRKINRKKVRFADFVGNLEIERDGIKGSFIDAVFSTPKREIVTFNDLLNKEIN